MTSALDELLLRGLTGRTPWKAECDACATANVTRSGEQTVDGVALVAGDRCLLTAETASKDNGIWVVGTGSWTRAEDFASVATCRIGSTVVVTRGTTNDGVYRMTVPTSGDVTPGVTAQTWVKIAEWDTAAGSYTAGDGLTLTGSDFDLDLTDTTKFTDAGVASRAVVLDASSRVIANGIRRTSGNFAVETVTSGTLTLASAGSLGLSGTSCTFTSTGALALSGTTCTWSATTLALDTATITTAVGGTSIAPTQRSTDAAPGVLTVRGGSAYGTATGANKVGGALRLGGGRGDDPGTDLGGDVWISAGRHIADNSTASIRFSYGDATDDDFENTLFQFFRSAASYAVLAPIGNMLLSASSGFVNVSASNIIALDSTNGTGVYVQASGTTAIFVDYSGGVRLKFYDATSPVTKQTVTGSRGGNAALASLLTALAALGLITDSSTA